MNSESHCVTTETLKEMMHVVMAQQFALRIALTAVLRTHPEAKAALGYFDGISETLKASFLHSQWSDERIGDFEFHLDSLRNDLAHKEVFPVV